MAKRAKKPAPPFIFKAPLHRVDRSEWDNTMRAAMTGLIARGDTVGDGSYDALVMFARCYAHAAHGERPLS